MKKRVISCVLSVVAVFAILFGMGFGKTTTVEAATASQNNIVARANYMWNATWVCQKQISGWRGNYTFYKGNTYRLPYAWPVSAGGYIGYAISVENFLTAAKNASSVFYTSQSHLDYGYYSTYYGNDCSAFVSWCWGISRNTTYTIPNNATYIGEATTNNCTYNLQLGDALNDLDSHVVLVTGLTYNSSGAITQIEITEQTPPQLKRSYYTPSGLSSKYYGNYQIYRYKGTVPASPGGSSSSSGSGSSSSEAADLPTKKASLASSFTARITYASANMNLSIYEEGVNNVKLYTPSTSPAQQWKFEKQSDGTYKITNVKYNQCMTVEGGSSADKADVILADDDGSKSQRWTVLQTSAGKYVLRPACAASTTAVLDVFGGETAAGTEVWIYTYNASDAQHFSFDIIEEETTVKATTAKPTTAKPTTEKKTTQKATTEKATTEKVTEKPTEEQTTTAPDVLVGYDAYKGGRYGNSTGKVLYEGLDISSWQGGSFNFQNIKNAGYDYVILRCGTTKGKDEYFESNYQKAKAAGLDVGAYYYSYALNVSAAKSDAQNCLSWIAGKKFEYPIYFDYEDPSQESLSNTTATNICLAFMDMVADKGYLVGMYTGLYKSTVIPTDTICAKYEFWVAAYYNDGLHSSRDKSMAAISGMYQYTSSKYVNGVGPLDANVCYKDYPAIVKQYGFNGYTATGTNSSAGSNSGSDSSTESAPLPTKKASLASKFTARIVFASANMNLSIYEEDVNNVKLYTPSTSPAQQWKFEKQSDGTYKITNVKYGQCMTVEGGSAADKADVILADDDGSKAQRWTILEVSAGKYVLRPACASSTTAVLDVFGGETAAGTEVWIYTYNATDAQHFSFDIIEEETTEKQTTEKQTTEKQTTEKKTTEKKTTQKQTTEKQTTEKQTTEKQTTEKKTTQKQTTEKQTTEKQTTEKQTTQKQTVEETSAEQVTTEKQPVPTQKPEDPTEESTEMQEETTTEKKPEKPEEPSTEAKPEEKPEEKPTEEEIDLKEIAQKLKIKNFKQATYEYGTTAISMVWSTNTNADGYVVYRADVKNGTYKKVGTVTDNYFRENGLEAGSKYYYKVRAYKVVNGEKVYGSYSTAKRMITKPEAPKNFKVQNAGKNAVRFTWEKTGKVNGFTIYVASSRNGEYSELKTLDSLRTSYTKTGLKKGQKLYVKARSFRLDEDGAKVYSGYTKILSITVK